MVGRGLERGSGDTRKSCVVSGLVFHRAMTVLALSPPLAAMRIRQVGCLRVMTLSLILPHPILYWL
jgi:hypothetical protein